MNNVQMNLDELDLQKLTKEQAQDIQEIEDLQKQIEMMSGNLSVGDVSAIDNQLISRPSVYSQGGGRKTALSSLQYEIEKY